MLLIFSSRCNESEYIRREITVAGNKSSIIPFRIEDVEPKRGLSVRLANLHWIDAFVARSGQSMTWFARSSHRLLDHRCNHLAANDEAEEPSGRPAQGAADVDGRVTLNSG